MTNEASAARVFPFDAVVISFPDANAALVASTELAALEQDLACPIRATTDPFGRRVGSGGALLDVVRTHCCGEPRPESSILLVLAGGESSRCPTQMTLGKAWTSLPSLEASGKAALTTPLQLGLKTLSSLTGIPRGSVVVIAGDTLLHLPKYDDASFYLGTTNFDVIGLAVPAPCETAQNHGVYVFDESPDFEATQLLPTTQVWQKPTLSKLHSVYSTLAWIDTGVVLFLPSVVEALCHLSRLYFSAATTPESDNQHDSSFSLIKLDLYTHVLQALRTSSSEHDKDSYCDSFPLHEQSLAGMVWDVLSSFSLGIWCRPGDFLHLGTSRELVDFLQVAVPDASSEENATASKPLPSIDATRIVRKRVGLSLPLIPRLNAVTQGVHVSPSVVATDVLVLDTSGQSKVGPRSVLEHCHLQVRQHPVDIGADCLVSGLRPIPEADLSWKIPDGMLVHMVPWPSPVHTGKSPNPAASFHVLIVLGLDDDIKSQDTLFGRPWSELYEWTGLSEEDLWEESASVRNLWTARIHEILHPQSKGTILDWLSDYLKCTERQSPSNGVTRSILKWKESQRRSLLEIRDGANSAAREFDFRRGLLQAIKCHQEAFFRKLRSLLLIQHFETLDWRWIVQEFHSSGDVTSVCKMLNTLDAIICSSLLKTVGNEDVRYDICGRSCRISSSFLRDLTEMGNAREQRIETSDVGSFDLSMAEVQEAGQVLSHFQSFASRRDCLMRLNPIQTFRDASTFMESMAQTMTSRCVFGSMPRGLVAGASQPPVIGRWVIATAPARIDFEGGWTDTPPICFEYGSCVTGVAVLVDDLRPLSGRCRIVPGLNGILLRAEDRDGRSGALRSPAVEARISRSSDLADYGTPTADCALLKCALVLLGLQPQSSSNAGDPADAKHFQAQLSAFCCTNEPVGLEIVATSLLPHGSGLGTSSILGGCVLACLEKCLGRGDASVGRDNVRGLLDAVLKLEQLLTTGGGFQDQVNGLVGGAKTVRCDRLVLPLKLDIESLPMTALFRAKLSEHLVLVFTGKTRLAKNLLQNVLSRWSRQTAEILDTVARLASGAENAREAILREDLDDLGVCLSSYWDQKKVMAGGAESGVEPALVTRLLRTLRDRGAIRGASLCGAGGGGFLVLLAAEGFGAKDSVLLRAVADEALGPSAAAAGFTWHRCEVSDEGLLLQVADADVAADARTFHLAWHRNPSR